MFYIFIYFCDIVCRKSRSHSTSFLLTQQTDIDRLPEMLFYEAGDVDDVCHDPKKCDCRTHHNVDNVSVD